MPTDDPVAITRTIEGPWGPLSLAATARGIAAAESQTTEAAFRSMIARRLGGPVADEREVALDDPRRAVLDEAAAAIGVMLAGQAPKERVPVDLGDRPA